MEREIIELTEFDIAPILYEYAVENEGYQKYFDEDGDIIGDPIWNQFEFIEEKATYYDLEKCYERKETIVRRISDGKFFRGSWIDSPHAWNGNSYNTRLTEVFPVQRTITVYE